MTEGMRIVGKGRKECEKVGKKQVLTPKNNGSARILQSQNFPNGRVTTTSA